MRLRRRAPWGLQPPTMKNKKSGTVGGVEIYFILCFNRQGAQIIAWVPLIRRMLCQSLSQAHPDPPRAMSFSDAERRSFTIKSTGIHGDWHRKYLSDGSKIQNLLINHCSPISHASLDGWGEGEGKRQSGRARGRYTHTPQTQETQFESLAKRRKSNNERDLR